MRSLAVLGSTGSIGVSTLEVAAAYPGEVAITCLAAGRNRECFLAQCETWKPRCVSLATELDARWLADQLTYQPEIHWGQAGLLACAEHPHVDTVVAAVMGVAGLASTEKALRLGKRVCLANKESLVVGGPLMLEAQRMGKGELLPVDSEHAALHQLLMDRPLSQVRELRLTASGGPFRDWAPARIAQATVEEALNHPTWKMGAKITIDSASMMNKGLEVIEAAFLFGLPADRIQVTLHPQSQVHAMVGFVDGSYHLQVCANDMKHPIQYALFYPERRQEAVQPYDWSACRTWTFEAPDLQRFPCLRLAFEALRTGGTAPAILNAANEATVAAFLAGKIPFGYIAACNEAMLSRVPSTPLNSLEQVLSLDGEVRGEAEAWMRGREY